MLLILNAPCWFTRRQFCWPIRMRFTACAGADVFTYLRVKIAGKLQGVFGISNTPYYVFSIALIKGYIPITFSPPWAQPEVINLSVSYKIKAHILILNLKFHLQIYCAFGDIAENLKFTGIPIKIISYVYFMTASVIHPQACTFSFALGE